MNSELIEASRAFVQQIYNESNEKSLFYHNWKHTEQVYTSAMEIANNTEGVANSDIEILALAVLFHDVAYTKGSTEHEKDGAEIATKFLAEKSYDSDKLITLGRLIMATKMGHVPTDLLEEIIQDADYSHLGNPDYLTSTYDDLYKEIEAKHKAGMTKEQWAEMCSEFIHKHQYHTPYAKTNYAPHKKENLSKIDLMVKDLMDGKKPTSESSSGKIKSKKKGGKGKSKSELPEKGVETMFRVALRNHMSLSQIADNKANTLISVNGIILSIVLSVLFPKMDNNPYIIYPGISMMAFSIVTIILAILSTIPKATEGTMSRKEVEEKKGNLIFFGNFHKMSLEEYEWGIGELMKDRDYLYKSLTRDLYFLGKVLDRKYKLLRWSYFVFVTGLIITIALFAISAQGVIA